MTGPLVSSMAAVEAAVNQSDVQLSQSKITFVDEIRTDRLNTLWKSTLAFVLVLAWLLLILTASQSDVEAAHFVMPVVFTIVASIGTRFLLAQDRYHTATWVYSLGLIASAAALTLPDSEDLRTVAPMIGVLIVFVIGMLLSVRETLLLVFIAYISMILPAWIIFGDIPVTAVKKLRKAS